VKCELCKSEWDERVEGGPLEMYGLKVCEGCRDNWYCGDASNEAIQEILKGAQFGDDTLRKRIAKIESEWEKNQRMSVSSASVIAALKAKNANLETTIATLITNLAEGADVLDVQTRAMKRMVEDLIRVCKPTNEDGTPISKCEIIGSYESQARSEPVVISDKPRGGCTSCEFENSCSVHADMERCGQSDWNGHEPKKEKD
jgi:hypothetical protein